MHEVLRLLATYFWLLFVFGGVILSWLGEVFDVGISALKRRRKARRKHELALRRLELKIAQAKAAAALPAGTLPEPGPCPHRPRNVKPVYSGDEPVAWLCTACGTQLPANWAVRSEDL
jgi:hypothetical protein